jgi:NAD(P)-dependent dehydrogenase (short-subunit alcohol dehydrogenase family)
MDRVKGKVAIVTGGAQRVGRTICLLLAREGANVAVLDVEDAAGEAVAAEIREHGGEARYWHMDVRREAEVSRVVGDIASHFGRVDVLVNNANVGGTDNATDAVTEAQWDEVMAVNVKGLMFCTKHVVPLMRHQGCGSIVNVSSIYGIVGSPHAAAFHASKGAVRIMTSTDALAYADDRIRVNVIMAGFIWNPADDEVAEAGGVNAEMARNAMAKMHPLGILGEPEDVAYGVLYLASDEAKFVTGTALVVDGGYTSR